jgi:hypothetical protein
MVHVYEENLTQNRFEKNSICWSTIFAGVVAGMIVQVVLSLLGLAIGFNAFEPGQHSYTGLSLGSSFWLLFSALISGFVGGWVATALANISHRFDALMQGVLSWGIFMMVAFTFFGSSMGMVIGGTFNLSSAVLTGASQGIVETATRTRGIAAVREQANELTQQMNQSNTEEQEKQQRIQQERAADAAAKATWGAFIIAVVSLIASAFGGILGLKRKAYTIV